MSLSRIHLVVFLSRATPLTRWDEGGTFEREMALYRALRPHLGSIRILSPGGLEELEYRERCAPIEILHDRWKLSPNLHSVLAPAQHRRALREATLYRTHQLDGAWTGAIASRLFRKPLLVRGGYLWAEFFERENGPGRKARWARRLQGFALRAAHGVILATEEMKRKVVERYGVSPKAIEVIPNYVDTDRFRPLPEVAPVEGRVCYVGRLHPRKNLRALFAALARVPEASLAVIGRGEEGAELRALASREKLDVHFIDRLEHHDLPFHIAQAQVFVLPSLFEGHPKSLIEAMACGAAVVGADADGIREVIRHEETGLLCPPTAEGLEASIRRRLADRELRRRLGTAARGFAEREYSLPRIVERELSALERVQR